MVWREAESHQRTSRYHRCGSRERRRAMKILGLTGSVGMGKSTTAQMFVSEGVPMFDADAAVHHLYKGEAAPLIEREFPGTTANGQVDREKLSAQVVGKPEVLSRLEKLVHPL